MSGFKDFMQSIDKDVKKGVAIALAIILLFSCGNLLGGLMSGNNTAENVQGAQAQTQAPATAAPTQAPTAAPVTEAPTAAPATTAPAGDVSEQPSAQVSETQAPSTGAPSTNADILKLFNESANKIKTSATKVVRNYEDLRHDADKLVLPSALQSIGSGLISQFLKKDETPIEYTGADIAASYPVPGESYVSQLTEADLVSATCTDNGSEYEITLVLVTQTDPQVGTGVGAACEVIKSDDVYNAVPAGLVQNFSAEYYDCTIKCKIDKATGNMTWANYTTPIILSVTAKLIVTLDATIGMTFEKDYTISY